MTGTVLERSLRIVAQRLYKLRVLRRQALYWVLLLVPAVVLVMLLPQLQGLIPTSLPVLLGVTLIGLALARWKVPSPTAIETARLVEKNRPELNDVILTAVRADQSSRHQQQPSILNEWVIEEADQLARQSDWRSVIPGRQMLAWSTMSFLSFCFLVTGVVAAGRWGRDMQSPEQLLAAKASGQKEMIGQTELTIEPGNIELERGTSLTVVARFGRVLPSDVVLQLNTADGSATFAMEPTVDEGVFAAVISSVTGDATYRVLFGSSVAELSGIDSPDFGNKSELFSVTTYVRPRLQQADVLITPPAYTKKPEQLIEDTLRITAVEGSTVQLTLHLNKPVAIAELRADDGSVISLVSAGPEIDTVTTTLEAIESRTYQVYLEDDAGRTAADEETISLKVTRNQRPKIKMTFPGRDTNVSPLQEFQIEAEATDDFGITDFGVMYSISSGDFGEVSLANRAAADSTTADASPGAVSSAVSSAGGEAAKVKLQHTIEMETLNAVPDELLSYSFYVEDVAADGTPRRTYSDMMFAEVRRFEEIFRESDQQSQQQQQEQQQGGETEKLMELQRQIMIATWNIQRALDETRPKEKAIARASEDAGVVIESQQQAIEQLQEVKEKAAQDPEISRMVDGVERDMQKAVETLNAFKMNPGDSELSKPFSAEQSAFAGLMRMRAKEHEIQRSQSQQGKGQGKSSASQQQLSQLELDSERNRYESESQAQQQQEENAAQGEQLQILNRLKELARRQEMVNDRLKQLESELRAAETQAEKDEIERELKRLREEQREMLRDVDELRETMDQQSAEQQQQNQQTREQVEQARERVQQAAQAMDEGNLAKAISDGTRAERQFAQLQEEFRNQTSNKFAEAMQDLRDQARRMSERQEEIAREMAGEAKPEDAASGSQRPSLRNERDRAGLQEKVAKQRDDLERVLEQAKELVEKAEDSEPLLSRRLYDTIRETREKKPAEALEATEILVSRGLWNQGQQAEQIARKGIDDLAKGIENAADAVLGSEVESLRRAQEEIEDLANQLSSEIAQATGQNPDGESKEQHPGVPGYGQQLSEPQVGEGSGDGQQAGGQPSQQRQGIQRAAAPLPSELQAAANAGNQSSQQRQSGQQTPGGAEATDQSQHRSGEMRAGETARQQNGEQQDDQPQQGEQVSGEAQEGQSQQPGQQPGQGQQGEQTGQQQSGQSGQGQQSGQLPQPGQGQQQGQPSQQGQNGQQPGKGQQSDQSPQPGQGQQSGQGGRSGQGSFLMRGGRESNGGQSANQGRPLTGDEFSDWSNRLREVEEILDDPELRNRVAQVRDRARSIRAEFRRQGTEPQWDLVKSQLLDEMTALQKRISQELSKRNSDRSMVPIDREPVPEEFDDLVRRYYELLGQSRQGNK